MSDEFETPVLDMTAGSRMMWFDKHSELATFVDKRRLHERLLSGHVVDVDPDVLADWTLGLPFEDETYNLVLFDPPHLIHAGDNSWLAKKYGTLNADNWQEVIKLGFDEGMRVLKKHGTLVFKWNDSQIPLKQILNVIDYQPLFGQKRQKTHWLVFMKF
jgi:hypothetical protein